MKMKREFHIKLVVTLIATLAVAGVAGFLFLKFAIPQHYFQWYPVIPACFILLCLILSFSMERLNRRNPDQVVAVFFGIRIVKMLVLIAGLLVYYRFVGQNMLEFGVTVLVFFVIYRVTEISMYCNFEKKDKEEQSEEE